MQAIAGDVQSWGVFSQQKGYAFNGYAVDSEAGTVLIDPPDPGEDGWPTVDLLDPFAGLWLTNRNHSRAAAAFRERCVEAKEALPDRHAAEAPRAARTGRHLPLRTPAWSIVTNRPRW